MPPVRATAHPAPKSKTAQSTDDWRANKRRENPNFDKEQAEAAKRRRDAKKLEQEAEKAAAAEARRAAAAAAAEDADEPPRQHAPPAAEPAGWFGGMFGRGAAPTAASPAAVGRGHGPTPHAFTSAFIATASRIARKVGR